MLGRCVVPAVRHHLKVKKETHDFLHKDTIQWKSRHAWRCLCSRTDFDGPTSLSTKSMSKSPLLDGTLEFSFWRECLALLTLSTPAFFQGFLAISLTSVVYLFMGRLGSLPLSIASLSFSLFSLTGASVISGLSMGIETIGGQANGAGNAQLVSVAFLQGLFSSLIACLVISLVWSQAEWVFLKLGQTPSIATKAAHYLQLLIPYLFTEAIFSCQTKALEARGIVRPTTIACGVAILVSPLLSWFLIFKTRYSMYGGPIALTLISLFIAVTLSIWTHPVKIVEPGSVAQMMKEGWGSFRRYMSVTLPGLGTLCSEWWSYEIFTVAAGILSSPELSLGIMGASNSIINILFVVALGLATGVLVRVSNFLGAGFKRRAMTSARTAVFVAVIIETVSLITICYFARPISRIWFSDPTAESIFVTALPLISLTEWGSGMSFVLGGILRACNRGKYELFANFGCYWFVGIPLGFFLGFALHMGVIGFWIGLATAAQLQFIVLALVVRQLNFDLEMKRAHQLTDV